MNISRLKTESRSNLILNSTRLLAAAMFLFGSSMVIATPEEDLQKGIDAYNQGDVVGAMTYYQKAADDGYAPAMSWLGYILDQSEQEKEAVEWYKKAVELGNPEAKHRLGEKYAGGESEGVEQDFDKARQLITEAAEAGHINAMHALATEYERGGMGLQINQEKVIYWLEQGARLGDLWSIQRLVKAYRWGETGLAVDEEKAKQWESRLTSPKAK